MTPAPTLRKALEAMPLPRLKQLTVAMNDGKLFECTFNAVYGIEYAKKILADLCEGWLEMEIGMIKTSQSQRESEITVLLGDRGFGRIALVLDTH